ncbi:MAG: hypothetical protein EBZ77_13185, partial [Chitinophagia bacterium]|nr:hypothetical protein [Chitinophagia bacterium]
MITAVTLKFEITAVSGTGTPTCTVYGYNGDISTLSASSIYGACTSGTASIYTATWGTTTVSRTLATTAAADTIVARNLSGKISMCWVLSASSRVYSINGTTTPVPVLTITTCSAPTAVSINASPNPVCSGSTISITGAATSGSTYSWSGPAGFSSTALSPSSFTAGTVSAGVYTFTATSACGSSTTVTKQVYVGTSTPSAISGATRICGATGVSTTLTNTATGGLWTSGTPSNATIDPNTGVVTSVSTGATTITYATGCGTAATSSLTVSNIPSVAVSVPSGSSCYGSPVSITASGASTYRWSPSSGLSSSTTANVAASPTVTTVYTVTGTTTSTGCTNTATTTITGSADGNAFQLAAVAAPTLTCTGGATTLVPTISNTLYNTVTSIPYSPVSTAGTSVLAGEDDNNVVVSLPFTFYYYGNAITSVSICSNGFINLGTPVTDLSSYSLPDASAPEGLISLFMHDLNLGEGGNIKYQTLGTAPNRSFVVSFNAVSDYGGATTNTGQIILYETSNNIDILIASCRGSVSGFTMTTGIQDLTGSSGLMPPGRDNTDFDATNEAWRFTGVPTSGYLYSWTPAASLSSSTAASPVASPITGTTTFSVTV